MAPNRKKLLVVSNILPVRRDLLYEMIGIEHLRRRTSVLGDTELARAAQRGDVVSLGILLERHRASLYALALRILGHGPQTEDAVQDVFVVALSSIDRLREPEAVGGWLRSILRNVCLTRLREGREILFDDPPGLLKWECPEPSAEQVVDHLALREWVWTALSELSEDLRVTAMLRYFGSYPSYEEISAILGVPVGTVGSRLSQVKLKLADALLETAELAHSETRRRAEYHVRFAAETAEAFNRGEVSDEYINTFSEDVVGTFGQWGFRGREMFARGLWEDIEDGVKLHPTNVIASEGVIVMEANFESPPEDPFHCPPAMSQVAFLRGDRVHRTRIYHAPRL